MLLTWVLLSRLELAIAWYTGLDCVDVAMMSFIAHAPTVRILFKRAECGSRMY